MQACSVVSRSKRSITELAFVTLVMAPIRLLRLHQTVRPIPRGDLPSQSGCLASKFARSPESEHRERLTHLLVLADDAPGLDCIAPSAPIAPPPLSIVPSYRLRALFSRPQKMNTTSQGKAGRIYLITKKVCWV